MRKVFVRFLYQIPAFGAFDDFSDFVESTIYEPSESCQVRGSNPCREPTLFSTIAGFPVRVVYGCQLRSSFGLFGFHRTLIPDQPEHGINRDFDALAYEVPTAESVLHSARWAFHRLVELLARTGAATGAERPCPGRSRRTQAAGVGRSPRPARRPDRIPIRAYPPDLGADR